MNMNKDVIDKNCMAGYILKQILFSENFKLSNKKRAEIVKNLFTLEELTKLPKPYGEAYYDALQRIEPSIQYVKRC